MNADTIEIFVEKLLLLKKTFSKEQIDLMEEFNDFKKGNKLFYETILSDQMDTVIFKKMMKLKRDLEKGEDSYGVDVKFGKYMAEKYVDPITSKLPKQN